MSQLNPNNKNAGAQPSPYSVQELLSLGYVFLVLLGIISDVIYYSFLDVEILAYSTILDVLISPINIIARDLRVFAIFAVTILAFYILLTGFIPFLNKRFGSSPKATAPEKKPKKKRELPPIIFIAIMIFSLYFGYGLGRGRKTMERIKQRDINWSHELVFQDGDRDTVYLLGNNSSYLFYVPQETYQITISPIGDTVKKIFPFKTPKGDSERAD